MNKLLFGAALVGVSASLTATAVFAAANSKVTLTTGNKSTNLAYNVADGVTAELPVKGDFLSLASTNSIKDYTEKKFSVTSTTGTRKPVDIKLVLTAEDVENSQYSPLDYYDIKLADKDGNYIYNGEDNDVTGETRLEFDLGTFNQSFSNEQKDYTIYYKINPDMLTVIDKSDAAKVKFVVEATPVVNTISAVSPVTSAPQASDSEAIVPSPETVAPEEAPPAEPTETAAADGYTEKTYVCGTDIEPGRYIVDGNANVTIKDKTGNIIKEFIVSDGSLGDFGGDDKVLVSLEKDDTVTVRSLTPDTKATVNFKSAALGSKETAAPKATANAASKTSGTSAPKTSAKSTNPKTGDNGIAIPAIVTVMILSAGFVGALEVLKRRNFN